MPIARQISADLGAREDWAPRCPPELMATTWRESTFWAPSGQVMVIRHEAPAFTYSSDPDVGKTSLAVAEGLSTTSHLIPYRKG